MKTKVSDGFTIPPNALVIGAETLSQFIDKDPEWIGKNATQKTPLWVLGGINLSGSDISRLSPFITFRHNATFKNCLKLRIVEGTFLDRADFGGSAIEEIGALVAGNPNPKAPESDSPPTSASFNQCKQLKTARGTYHQGCVDFSESGITEIDEINLIIHRGKYGEAARFRACPNLKIAKGSFPGMADFSFSAVEKIGCLKIHSVTNGAVAANFSFCENLKTATGEFMGDVNFTRSGITKIKNLKLGAGHADDRPITGKKSLRCSRAKFRDVDRSKYLEAVANFAECYSLMEIPPGGLDNPNWKFDDKTMERIQTHRKIVGRHE